MSVERSGFRRRFRLAGAATAAFALPSSATAHGFAQRYDLPIPLYLYLAGAGAAVALTFVLAAVLVRGTARATIRASISCGRDSAARCPGPQRGRCFASPLLPCSA